MPGSSSPTVRVRWETISHHVADIPTDQVPGCARAAAWIFGVEPVEAWLNTIHDDSYEAGSASRLLDLEQIPSGCALLGEDGSDER
jgi:hypothetical protein